MKKTVIIIAALLFCLVVLVVVNPPEIIIEEAKLEAPDRPQDVPKNAFWVGGIDGGNFIYVVKLDSEEKLFLAKIYNDYTGDIEYEGILKYTGSNNINHSLNDASLYQGWDGEHLYLVNAESMRVHPLNDLSKP